MHVTALLKWYSEKRNIETKIKSALNNIQPNIKKKHIFFCSHRQRPTLLLLFLLCACSRRLRKRHKNRRICVSILFCLFYYGLCLLFTYLIHFYSGEKQNCNTLYTCNGSKRKRNTHSQYFFSFHRVLK